MTLKEAIPEVAAPSKPNTRVTKAAEWLDENYPGWYKRLKPETIFMSNGLSCVAGRLTGDSEAYLSFGNRSRQYMAFGADNSLKRDWTTEIEFRLARDIVNS